MLAAVLSYVVAEHLHTSDAPILAPLTALLVVQLTMYETVTHGRERIVSVVAGVLVAVGFAQRRRPDLVEPGAVVAVCLIAGGLWAWRATCPRWRSAHAGARGRRGESPAWAGWWSR